MLFFVWVTFNNIIIKTEKFEMYFLIYLKLIMNPFHVNK